MEEKKEEKTEVGNYKHEKSIEERLNSLEECCKENKIFIFKQISKNKRNYTENKKYFLSPYEEKFILNNLDILIQNYRNIREMTDSYEETLFYKLTHFIIWYSDESLLNRFGEENLEKIINFEINESYKGNINLFEEQLEHPHVRVDRKKTYDILKKIIKKIKESNDEEPKDEKPVSTFIKNFTKKEDGKIKSKRKSRKRKSKKKKSKKRKSRKM